MSGQIYHLKLLKAMKKHMYEKAFLMGRCVDKAVTLRKMTSEKVLLDKYVKGCIEINLKFVQWLDTAKSSNALTACERKGNSFLFPLPSGAWSSTNTNAPIPYDFLDFDESMSVSDYVTIRDCYEPCLKNGEYNLECYRSWSDSR